MNELSDARIARILNGTIVVAASLLTLYDARFGWLILFMGASLIFSGAADYCGFEKIFKRLRSGGR